MKQKQAKKQKRSDVNQAILKLALFLEKEKSID